MKVTGRSRVLSWVSSVAWWAAALMIAASIGVLWVWLAGESPSSWSLLAVPVALIGAVGIAGRRSRVRMRRRLQAALDAYAEREIGQERRRGIARKRVRTVSTALGTYGKFGARLRHELGKS